MSSESKGREFFYNLLPIERDTILEIMRLENTSERLLQVTSRGVETKIKEIIEKNSVEWKENDI